VRRVTFADDDTDAAPRATGVYVDIGGITRHARARREVILCGGAINTPQLLMLSGIGPADHLASHGIRVRVDAPQVGENPGPSGRRSRARGAAALYGARRPAQLARYLSARRGMLSSNVAEAYGFVRTAVADRTDAPPTCPTSRSSSRRRRTSAKAWCRPRRASRWARSCCSRAVAAPSASPPATRRMPRSSIPRI
jgi:choline dehydrogenase